MTPSWLVFLLVHGAVELASVEVEASGPISRTAAAAVGPHEAAFWLCADAVHGHAPLPARVEAVLALRVGAAGEVRRAAAVIKPHQAELAHCLRLAARRVTFSTAAGPSRVRVSLVFTAPEPP